MGSITPYGPYIYNIYIYNRMFFIAQLYCSNLHGDMRLSAHSAGLLVLVAESVTAKKKAETARAP